ncbi:hypothetical protein COV04_00755 [Candidatus Uhrbacteria bacterium CG10_big_fil_rev_8_21_14_0_10_48_11]|uniref:MobA-like NTP transferase domain-containing protein n=1 Tax=Candidatus Uhrbacteria bacterium CG10_big_fil_rev_8_21_14_0_10_48_11 TaxID=1975037 RepID=A0A2M8LFH2_9BACT|nr:MAG: hypothetical protein COV04_00755 [Candidatus Uhrbacteria bacterium CG10_big_fil_rev_8_21_14_0_10_48_11]
MKKPRVGIVILAAGKGKRMGHALPKVLVPVAGKPMILRAVTAAENSKLDGKPTIVIGYKGSLVKQAVGKRAYYVLQNRSLGTGHAVAVTESALKGKVDYVVVTYGDHPFVTPVMLRQLVRAAQGKRPALSCITISVPDYRGFRQLYKNYGRIVRDKKTGSIRACIEYKDATKKERAIREVNSGQYCFEAAWLWKTLPRLQKKNVSKEYYLTDLIALAVADGLQVRPMVLKDWRLGIGANTLDELHVAERFAREIG